MLERIDELVIPPAWKDVWISPYPGGHIQATGVDAAGRKQYLYHRAWRERRDAEKFADMLAFARALPRMRERVNEDLRGRRELDEARVLACAVRLLDRGFFRIGTEDYAVTNETYGLATMRKAHVTIHDDRLVFDYPAKHSKRRVQSFVDPEVMDVVSTLKRRRGGGEELLAYRTSARAHWRDVKSGQINAYLKDATGLDVSAKDFRTWGATVLAAIGLATSVYAKETPTARKRVAARVVKDVAHALGNTPAVARASYIDPRVFDRFNDGQTVDVELVAADPEATAVQGPVEAAVLDLLEG